MSAAPTRALSILEVPFASPIVERLIDELNAERRTRMPGFTPAGGSTVEAADFLAPDGVFLVAMREYTPLGCGGLRRLSPGVGEIKRLFVSPPARGQGIARALLHALDQGARDLGYETLRLDTDGIHSAAAALFRSVCYQPIPDYNANPYARFWFEKRLGREVSKVGAGGWH